MSRKGKQIRKVKTNYEKVEQKNQLRMSTQTKIIKKEFPYRPIPVFEV